MSQPQSVRLFSVFYLAALVLMTVNSWVGREQTAAMITAIPDSDVDVAMIQLVSAAVRFGIGLLIWWLVAYRANNIARLLVVAINVIAATLLTALLAQNSLAPGLPGLLSLIVVGLNLVAIALLFMPDSVAWFAHHRRKGSPA